MKLFSNKLTTIQILFLLAFSIIEVICFLILFISYKPLFSQIFNQSRELSIKKTKNITQTLSQIFELSFQRYFQDLKLIGKHMSFLANNQINNKSQYYQNIINDENKHIYSATLENLRKDFNKYYDETQNKFLFFENYIKDYIENTTNQINILNDLMDKNKHSELNSISYYKYNGNIENNIQKKIAAKYLISILKTVFLNRLLVKGNDLEIIRYYLLTYDEIYIYPPEPLNSTLIYSLKDNIECDEFPYCVFYYFTSYMYYVPFGDDFSGYFFPIIPVTILEYEEIVNTICLSIPFDQKFQIDFFEQNAIMCMDINMTIMLQQHFFQSKDAFNFLLFTPLPNTIIPFYSKSEETYSQVRKIFNDTKFGEYSLIENTDGINRYFNLFQFLYLDIFKEPIFLEESGITLDEIFDEYQKIQIEIFNEINKFIDDDENDHFVLDIEKTTCNSDLYYNGKKCVKDNFLLVVYKINTNLNFMNELFIENPNRTIQFTIFFSMSIISNNFNYMKWKLNQIIIYKIIRLFFFFFISSICFILLYFIFVKIFFKVKYNLINQILQIIKGNFIFESKNINNIIKVKDEIIIEANNKEMTQLKNLFDYLIKILILKIKFEKKEFNFKDKDKIINKDNKINIDTLDEDKDLINNINNDELRIMFHFIISYEHFKKGYFKISENEFKNLINEINNYQSILSNNIENNDSKLKDTISRCSKISYLNEYSLTNELNETTLPLIKFKLLTQKIYYLYAMCIFNQEKTKIYNDKKNNKDNIKKRYEEAIYNFIQCKNISILLGTDIIRQIYSLIMISKCYNELKNYKESMVNINEALLLFSDLQNVFKDKPYFSPIIMIFIENYIFQSIMLSLAQTTFIFNKYPQSCWILMKMIETSPFIFNNIHFQVCILLYNCLNQIENIYNIPLRQTDKYKKKINKILKRINIRLYNKENNNSHNNTLINNLASVPSGTNKQINNLNISVDYLSNIYYSKKLNKNKDIYTNKFSISKNSLNYSTKNKYKNITLCLSEKLLENINGNELKDFLIKCYKKCFSNGSQENKFNFIQFSCNGKKTISISSKELEIFLQKLSINKIAFKINDTYTNNNTQIQFMEFSNLLMNIIKSNKQENYEDKYDNIIIIFINTSDIRFNNQKECVDTINELNYNNYSIIIFTYDSEIREEKIEGIYSFVFGLNDGHFLKLKNYQQIRQILMNFCLKDSQEKFSNYNYEITDFML